MQSVTRIEQEERIRHSAVTFRHLLNALARPGTIVSLEYPTFLDEALTYFSAVEDEAVSVNGYALGAMMTLLDKEVTFALAANGVWLAAQDALVRWVGVRTGASVVAPESASFAFFCDGRSAGLLTRLHRGTLAEPEMSATAFYCVESLRAAFGTPTNEERSDGWLRLELVGPGIQTTHVLTVAGLDREELQDIRTTRQGYPLGVDVYLIDASGQCVGLPRTTTIKG